MAAKYPLTITSGVKQQMQVGDSLMLRNLTSGRVPYATTSGELIDSVNLTFNGSRLTATDIAVNTSGDQSLVIRNNHHASSTGLNVFIGGGGTGATYVSEATEGSYNVSFGFNALAALTSGYQNFALGASSCVSLTTGAYNVGIGVTSLRDTTSGSFNLAIGYNTLVVGNGSNNIALGYAAGLWETGSNKLFIDSIFRSNEADGRAKALVYGVFAAAQANQLLAVNGVFEPYGLTAGRLVYSAAGTINTKLVDSANLTFDGTTLTAGGLTSAGYITGVKCGAFASLDAAANTTVTTAGTYYPIAGTFTNSPLEQFGAATAYTPGIKYTGTLTQYFEIDWHATCHGDANSETVLFGVKKNNVLVSSSVMGQFLKTTGEKFTLSGTCVVSLATNDEIQLVLTSDTDGDVITVEHFTTSINEFFD